MTYNKALIALNGTLDPTRKKDTLIFAYQHAVGLLRRLQTLDHQCSPRIDFDTSTQRLQLFYLVGNPVTKSEVFKVQ